MTSDEGCQRRIEELIMLELGFLSLDAIFGPAGANL